MNATIRRSILRLRQDERGLTTVEYAIVLCLIAAVAVGAWKQFGQNVLTYLGNATTDIGNAMK